MRVPRTAPRPDPTDSSTATNAAATTAPMIATVTMRKRSLAERLVTKVSAISRIAQNANWPQAARENDRNSPPMTISSRKPPPMNADRRPASMRWRMSSPGSTRNAPNTFGSLNVPRGARVEHEPCRRTIRNSPRWPGAKPRWRRRCSRAAAIAVAPRCWRRAWRQRRSRSATGTPTPATQITDGIWPGTSNSDRA